MTSEASLFTQGQPFFRRGILKALITAGDIFYVNERWEHKPLSEVRIPRSAQDAVELRAARLSEDARRVLILAAVAGKRFDFALLQYVAHDERKLLLFMGELIAAQLVVEESTDRFAFRHALTREAIYAQLLGRERKTLHRAIADTMERLYASVSDAYDRTAFKSYSVR